VLYSVEQVAEQLGLHVKTVRNYIREGRLKAVRVGKQYRISAEDLAAFTGQPAAPERPRRHTEVSSIVQMDNLDFEAMSKLSNMIVSCLTGPYEDEPLRVETAYDRDRASLKIIILGGPNRTADLLKFITMFAEQL
jgi:excisionase family DNA binding protein